MNLKIQNFFLSLCSIFLDKQSRIDKLTLPNLLCVNLRLKLLFEKQNAKNDHESYPTGRQKQLSGGALKKRCF